jgi:hypothetical protein
VWVGIAWITIHELAGEILHARIIFVAQAVNAALHYANTVVQPFHEVQRHFVRWAAVRNDFIPVPLDIFRQNPRAVSAIATSMPRASAGRTFVPACVR